MESFEVLVVDDDQSVHDQVWEKAAQKDGVNVVAVTSLAEAREAIESQFFHVAYVDLQLEAVPDPNPDGLTVLRELYDARPSCKRILLTQYATEYRTDVFRLLRPETPIISGAVDKIDHRYNFVRSIEREAELWLDRPISVVNLAPIFHEIERSKINRRNADGGVQTTVDELNYILSRLFGQSHEPKEHSRSEAFAEVELQPLEGGKSRSVVLVGKPRDEVGREGIYCVVKIGARAEAEEEHKRYQRYVQLRVSLDRRVEMLAAAFGDTLGAVCYSFAGRSPDRIVDFASLLEEESDSALELVSHLFGNGASEWYAHRETKDDLAGFFATVYGFEGDDMLKQVSDFAERNATKFGARKVGPELVFDSGKIQLPQVQDLGAGRLRDPYPACIVHGDLHAGNVLVADDGRVTLIDYRHTGRGPRTLDFASLEASVRLTDRALTSFSDRILADHRLEIEQWSTLWEDAVEVDDDAPYWYRASAHLVETAREDFGGLTPQEYAETCFLYALRVFRVSQLDKTAKLRLLVWISALSGVLRDAS
jgi:CheY-like chemotaxis protein